tara:strand:+ start:6942 stop:9254 length:2313 start_codon:yes stop_codon:yes gene_type:complete
MLPAVTSTPIDPTWHPNGSALAYSMRGDIWVQTIGTNHARAITQGPGYHFEPAWSPDGKWIALTVDINGQLDIAMVRGDGTAFRNLTSNTAVDIQPAWTPDGRFIVFASTSERDFDIMKLEVATGSIDTLIGGPGNQFQPAPSPDGTQLAYIAKVVGYLGSGGIWTMPMSGGKSQLVHYEETSYRPVPTWTPDGSNIVFASDAAGSYDLAIVPSAGGNRVRLTSQAHDEFAPAVSPDGKLVAFVSNQNGPTTLYLTSQFGDGNQAWQPITPLQLSPQYETATLQGQVTGPNGRIVPARIQLLASDGRGYVPNGIFHRVSPVNEIHYFHSTGEFEVTVPAGEVRVEAIRGFEWIPADITIYATKGKTMTVKLQMERLADPYASSWVSGDTHVHDLHEGRYGLTQQEFFNQLRADDLHVTHDLIHMDGTKIMGRWSDLTGEDYPGSTDNYILRYAQEFRGSFSHVALLGVTDFIMPLIGGTRGSPYPADGLKIMYLDSINVIGGLGGFLHPYTPSNGNVNTAEGAAQSDIPIHVILERGNFYDVVSIASDEISSAKMYYHMLNVGAQLSATGGTDNFSNVWRDPSGGTARTYARLNGPLTWNSWIEAVRAGRTFATNGPLLMANVDGHEPGSTISGRDHVTVSAELATIAPVEVIEIIIDGKVVHMIPIPEGQNRLEVQESIPVNGARWIAVRAWGGKARYSGDNYTFAHTTPVYFSNAQPNKASKASAAFLTEVIQEIWRQVDQRNAWLKPEDRDTYRQHLNEALARLADH